MRMERGQPVTGPAIKGFTAQGYRLDDVTVAAALLLTTERASDWAPPPLAELTIESLEPALTPKPEFVVLGTGANLRRPPAALIRALDERGIGLEPMDSRTAARTWSMLREEGRPIAAVLYPLEA